MQTDFAVKLDQILKRFDEIERQMSNHSGVYCTSFAKLSKEHADLYPLIAHIHESKKMAQEQADLKALLTDPNLDSELFAIAQKDIVALQDQIDALDKQLKILLLPRDAIDEKNAILEIRSGTGGDEASLFAFDLLSMYQRYCEFKGWHFEVLQLYETDLGGVREVSALICGKNVFAQLKFESGVHRVQRIPETEAGGRIHTSAATVAILPEIEEVDIQIADKDLRIDVFRSRGPGGQSVNTTDSAVRITHLPTGLVVQQQDEKSQHKNKAKALKILRTRLYDLRSKEQAAQRAESRKNQVGRGDRSERIRTYNFPQGRVTDHRIGLTLYQIEQVMQGYLDPFINSLVAEDQASRLADMENE